MDISRYLRENDNDEVRQEHFGRLMSGKEVWNAWVEGIQETLSVNAHYAEEYIINLSNQRFESPKVDELDFSNYIFPFDIVFDGSIFLASTKWHECRFQQSVDFKNVTFNTECDFSKSYFLKSLSFDKSTFKGLTIFIECNFASLSFFECTAERSVLFLDSSFWSLILISNQFTDIVSFGHMTQHPDGSACRFFNTVFSSHVDFIGFVPNNEEPVDFRQTTFKEKPIIDSFPLEFAQDAFWLENEGIFRTLRQIAQANNNHWLEVQYQALELRCARSVPYKHRNPDSSHYERLSLLENLAHAFKHLPNYAFDWLSGYGVSIKKPIRAWLLVTFLCCLVQYGSVKNKVPPYYHFCSTSLVCKVSDQSNTTPVSWNEALQFHFSPSIPSFLNDNFYLKELRQNYYKDGRIPALSRFVRLIQSLMTYVCLFLVGLALRNRFKL